MFTLTKTGKVLMGGVQIGTWFSDTIEIDEEVSLEEVRTAFPDYHVQYAS